MSKVGVSGWEGEWTAVDWEGAATAGGDPDPCADERVIQINDEGVHFVRNKKLLCFTKSKKELVAARDEVG
jgi:hypothetical protein